MERAPPTPGPAAHRRPLFPQRRSGRLLSQIVQNLALRQSQLLTMFSLLTVFSLYEQKVSVNYPKSIHSNPFEQFGVTGLTMHWTVAGAEKEIEGCFNYVWV